MNKQRAAYRLQLSVRGKQLTPSVLLPHTAFQRWETQLTEIRPHLISEALQIIHDLPLAEDLVQSSLLKAYRHLNNGKLHALKIGPRRYLLVRGGIHPELWKKLDEQAVTRWLTENEGDPPLDSIEEPAAWLRTIVRNTTCEYYNQWKKFLKFCVSLKDILPGTEPHFEGPEPAILHDERCEEVRALVMALPPGYREVIHLHYWEGHPFTEIAKRLHCPASTVRSHELRARKMLKEALLGQRRIQNGQLTRPQRSA